MAKFEIQTSQDGIMKRVYTVEADSLEEAQEIWFEKGEITDEYFESCGEEMID